MRSTVSEHATDARPVTLSDAGCYHLDAESGCTQPRDALCEQQHLRLDQVSKPEKEFCLSTDDGFNESANREWCVQIL